MVVFCAEDIVRVFFEDPETLPGSGLGALAVGAGADGFSVTKARLRS